MFLGKMTFEADTNDRFLLKMALELLEANTSMLFDTPEEQKWAKQRAGYWRRRFTER